MLTVKSGRAIPGGSTDNKEVGWKWQTWSKNRSGNRGLTHGHRIC
jgi:hypothetical protein